MTWSCISWLETLIGLHVKDRSLPFTVSERVYGLINVMLETSLSGWLKLMNTLPVRLICETWASTANYREALGFDLLKATVKEIFWM